jgi:Ni,Fe-hydrogenase III large subunit
MRLKERVLRVNEQLTGNRLLRGMACLGVRFGWDTGQIKLLEKLVTGLAARVDSLVELIQGSSSMRDRLEGTGILRPEVARTSASWALRTGVGLVLRQDFPHDAYGQ